jgi:ribosome biogenesis GTPase A
MARAAELDFDSYVNQRKGEHPGRSAGDASADPNDEHAYAYISDRTTRAAFDKVKPVELAVAASVRAYKSFGKNQILGHAVKVGPNQFPRVHEITRHCASTLGIVTPTVYIVNQPTLNAMTYGTNDDSFILVHSALVDHLSDQELLDVIGHEAGHIHNSHVVYLTTLHFLKEISGLFTQWLILPAMLALTAWSRRAEVTCDRAGMLCCKDLEVSTRSLAKLALGSHKLYDQLNLDAFVDQFEEGKEGAGKYVEVFSSHPWLPKRILALRAFAESALYKKHIGIEGGGLSMHDVDEKVHGIIKVVGLAMALEKFHERRHEVVRALGDLSKVSGDIGAKTLATRVQRDVIQKLEAGRFHLVVVGEFNHGKSSFVNALLGRPILPVGVTPTTAVIHHLEHANEPSAKVVFTAEGKAPEVLSLDELRTFAVGDKAAERAAEVSYIEVGYPAKLLEDRVVLVDTPGVNDLSLTRADITYKYIPRSDAVLFLLDAGQLIKESERVFLNEKLLAKSRDKIVFVVTKSDIWSATERAEAMTYVKRELAKLVTNPVVFAISAQEAAAGHDEAGGIGPLVEHLSKFLAEERGRIVLDHALGEGLAIGSLLVQGIDAKRHALRMSQEDLERRIAIVSREAEGHLSSIDARRAHIREEIAAIKAWSRRDLETFCEDVARQVPALVDKSNAGDIRKHLAAFLEKSFRDWAEAETGEIAGALEKLAERIVALVKEDAKDAAKKLGDALNVRAPTIEVDTFAYDVGIAALFAIGISTMFANFLLGGILTLAAPVLAFYVRDKVEIETKKRAKEIAPAALREAAVKVGPKLEEMIDEFAKQLDAWVISTGKDMYREMLEVLSAARDEKKARAGEEVALATALDEQGQRLAVVTSGLEKLRAALWTPETAEGASDTPAS